MDDNEQNANATSPRDAVELLRVPGLVALPDDILAVALRNDRKRFFIPSGKNSFAGIRYENVMIDSGCNSILLPFPDHVNDLQPFSREEFFWEVNWARGRTAGGVPTHSPTLLIYSPETNQDVGDVILADRFVTKLKGLRFHLGKDSARKLLESGMLDQTENAKLDGFLRDLGERDSPERRYVLLGQTVLSQVFSLQAGRLLLLAGRGYFPGREDVRTAWRVIRHLESSGLLPSNFHSLEDVDHDGDIVAAWSDDFEDENWDQRLFQVG